MDSRVYVDFNEMISPDEVLLSQTDSKVDSAGNIVEFFDGKEVAVYMDEIDDNGKPDNLIANGIVIRNTLDGWASIAKWVLKIDERGIRHESDKSNPGQLHNEKR